MENDGNMVTGLDYSGLCRNCGGFAVARETCPSPDVLQLRTSECGPALGNESVNPSLAAAIRKIEEQRAQANKEASVNPKELRDKANGAWLDPQENLPGSWIRTDGKWERILPVTGMKFDDNKSRVDLIDPEFLEGLGNVLRFGANKYTAHNWRGGIKYSRLLGAALRHLLALAKREDTDPESGLGHVFHVACCIMFLSWHLKHKPELDDRFKY